MKRSSLSLITILLFLATINTYAFEPLFNTRIDYAAGENPNSVFAVDLDGDGDNDLAVANNGYYPDILCTVSILLNNGDGMFQQAVNYGAGDGPLSVLAVDLDGDGDNDLTVANLAYDNVSVLLNNGDGTFQQAVNYGTGDYPISVFAVDLDGDGNNDLATANLGSDNVSVLLNNGDGTFQEAVNYGAGGDPLSVFAIDLDGDSDNDLAVANIFSNDISILINLSITTGIDNSPETYLPGSFSISQNYPNPFNATTTISYDLPKPSTVTLDIYDLLGRKVGTLVNAKQEAGFHQAVWNAEDGSSGMYFYKLQAGDYIETKKMVLIK